MKVKLIIPNFNYRWNYSAYFKTYLGYIPELGVLILDSSSPFFLNDHNRYVFRLKTKIKWTTNNCESTFLNVYKIPCNGLSEDF